MKRILCTLTVLMALVVCTSAHADMFGPRPEKKLSATQSLSLPTDPITVVSQISDKLGTKEGIAIDRWGATNYLCTTLYTYNGFGVPIGFNIGVVGNNGIGETVDLNIGAILPASNDPLTGILQYAWVGGGVDEVNRDGWEVSYLADIQIKFAFN